MCLNRKCLGFVGQKGHKHANRPVAVGLILTLAAVFIAYSKDVAAGDVLEVVERVAAKVADEADGRAAVLDFMRYGKVDDAARRRMMEVGHLTAHPAAFPPAAEGLLLASP